MKLRLFVAVELGDEVKRALESIQNRLKKKLHVVRWVKPDCVHLTLKFLGYVEEEKLSMVTEIMESCISGNKPFKIAVSGVGAFPRIQSPRVIWVGIKEETGALKGMADELDRRLTDIGVEKENRPYSPHLTLGRVKERSGREDYLSAIQPLRDEHLGDMVVNHISLIRSDLTPDGPRYTTLHHIPLH